MQTKLIIFLILFSSFLYAQEGSIFPDLEGDELLENLVLNYKTLNVLSYGEARDFMYSELDNSQDTVKCIYTGHAIYLPQNVDPSTFLYMGGSSNGINAEHAFPQSKGASEGNAKSDMHHLFSVRAGVNSARGNKFFGDVPDNLTSRWYWMDQSQEEIPTTNIDNWSERSSQVFEPKESSKGNIARAIFYFYTMYQQQADEADDFFFPVQRMELCQWHINDPVDIDELVRTTSISLFQDDKQNPFILDCSLAARTYCSDLLLACEEIPVSSCPTNMDVTTPFTNSVQSTKVASTTITSTSIIESGSNVIYQAGESVILKAGFHARSGSQFLAQIGTCSTAANSPVASVPLRVLPEIKIESLKNTLSISPNPTSGAVNIQYTLNAPQQVQIYLMDFSGRIVQDFKYQEQEEGQHSQFINLGNKLSSGLYTIVLRTEDGLHSKKVIYQKE